MKPIERFQIIVGIFISLATALISWQTFKLNEISQKNNVRLKEIEHTLSERKFDFDQVRDIYDRTEKFLLSDKQDSRRGRALISLINYIPDRETRRNLLQIIVKEASSVEISATAADGIITSESKLITVEATKTGNSQFSGDLVVKFLGDQVRYELLENFSFKDSSGVVWEAPSGFVASDQGVPRSFQSFFSLEELSSLRKANVVYSYYAFTRGRPYEQVHAMFYEAMIAAGLSATKARIIYAAVAQFGPRWDGAETND